MQMVDEEVNNLDMMGLSAREMEIIDLVADGLTNQEIAVKLTISKRTVDNHVSNMFTKTGSKNRKLEDVEFWMGKRAQAGKKVPKYFNKNLKFD